MSTRSMIVRSLSTAALAAALAGMTVSALAAQNAVNVQASKLQQSPTGAQSNVAQLTQRVSYADLDLSTHLGAYVLATRIHRAATSVCTQLGAIYPADSFFIQGQDQRGCVSGAVQGAMEQARVVIADQRDQQAR